MKGMGLRFIGRFANEGAKIINYMANGDVVGATIDMCNQVIGVMDSIIRYSEEVKRSEEIKKQYNYKKNELDKEVECREEEVKQKLNFLKKKLHEDYLKEKITLNSKLEEYKKEISNIRLGMKNNFSEAINIEEINKKLCGNLNNILDKIAKQINKIDKLEEDKAQIYILQEEYRAIQQQLLKVLK